MERTDVIGFYDAFVEEQRRNGINERILGLFRKLKKAGLNSTSVVLELGCGIGTMTGLIASVVKKGTVQAVDISPDSIAYAGRHVDRANVTFHAQDVVGFMPTGPEPDFVLLFDIIEHIPMAEHARLFQDIASYSGPATRVLVHIPSPGHVEYDRSHRPEVLQVIDQPLHATHLVEVITASGLEIIHFETYGIWMQNDYQYLILRKARDFSPQPLAKDRPFLRKVKDRLELMWFRSVSLRH